MARKGKDDNAPGRPETHAEPPPPPEVSIAAPTPPAAAAAGPVRTPREEWLAERMARAAGIVDQALAAGLTEVTPEELRKSGEDMARKDGGK